MAGRRMLHSRLFKGTACSLLIMGLSLACDSTFRSIDAQADGFTKSSMAIGSQADLILATQAALDTEMMVVFDRQPLSDVASVLASQAGVEIHVDSKLSNKLVEIVSDGSSLRAVVQKVSASAGVFLVYRDGFLLFSPTAKLRLKLSAEMSKDVMQELARRFTNSSVELTVNQRSLTARVTRSEFLVLREVLMARNIIAEIVSTDLVVDQLERL